MARSRRRRRHAAVLPATSIRGPPADPDSSDAVALCDELLYAAMVREASDIHIDPGESARAGALPRRRRAGAVSATADAGADRRDQPVQGAVRAWTSPKSVLAARRPLHAPAGADRPESRHPRRHAPDQARRADDAAAAGPANRIADDRAAGHERSRPGAFSNRPSPSRTA